MVVMKATFYNVQNVYCGKNCTCAETHLDYVAQSVWRNCKDMICLLETINKGLSEFFFYEKVQMELQEVTRGLSDGPLNFGGVLTKVKLRRC